MDGIYSCVRLKWEIGRKPDFRQPWMSGWVEFFPHEGRWTTENFWADYTNGIDWKGKGVGIGKIDFGGVSYPR